MAHKVGNWGRLQSWSELAGADVYLLSEASPPPQGILAIGRGHTSGIDAEVEGARPVVRPWATSVASNDSATEITDARLSRFGKHLPFEASRVGTWTAASVEVDGLEVTAIALYGLMDEGSDASVHRSLSEMSPIFDHHVYGERLLLGGDLNILAGRPSGERLDRHQVVLARIAAYGLIDCLAAKREPGPLPGCPCGLGDGCTHSWTKRVKQHPEVAYQDDYLFASPWLAERLMSCIALPFTDDSPSDHAPIVATFEL
jgi:hypothetical protein